MSILTLLSEVGILILVAILCPQILCLMDHGRCVDTTFEGKIRQANSGCPPLFIASCNEQLVWLLCPSSIPSVPHCHRILFSAEEDISLTRRRRVCSVFVFSRALLSPSHLKALIRFSRRHGRGRQNKVQMSALATYFNNICWRIITVFYSGSLDKCSISK